MFRTTDISQYMASWFSPKKPEMATNNCRIWHTCVRCFIRQTLFPMIVAHTLYAASSTYWRTIFVLLPSLTSLGVPFFPRSKLSWCCNFTLLGDLLSFCLRVVFSLTWIRLPKRLSSQSRMMIMMMMMTICVCRIVVSVLVPEELLKWWHDHLFMGGTRVATWTSERTYARTQCVLDE